MVIEPRPPHIASSYNPYGDGDPRLAALVADVGARLRPVCAQMAAADFEQLVHRIARMKLRWALREEAARASRPGPSGEPEPRCDRSTDGA